MTERPSALVAGLGALIKSVLLIAGVPLALARLWSLAPGTDAPTKLAAWRGGALWSHAVIAAVTAIWVVAAASLGRDLVRALRGRLVTPSGSWSARWASRLAGLVLLVSAGSAIGTTIAGASVPSAHVATRVATAAVSASRSSPAVARATSTLYTVRAGDCLTSIAEAELGDAGDWTILARLNMGRLQPDGRRMTDASLIYPGWQIRLPGASGAQSATTRAESLREPGATTATGTTADAPTSSAPDAEHAMATTAPLSSSSLFPESPGASIPDNPSGSTVPDPNSAERTATPARFPPSISRGAADGAARSTRDAAESRLVPASSGEGAGSAPTRQLEELAVLGVGLLSAAAVARRLRLLRRLAECLRRPGERIAALAPAVGEAIAAIDPLAETALIDWVDAANRLLWRACRGLPVEATLPEVRVVRAGPDGVSLRLGEALPDAPDGFVALDGGSVWALDSSLGPGELASMTEGCGRYVPGLVPVGDSEDATYLVALGPGQRLALDAVDGGAVDGELAALLVGLRTLPWCEELQVELVGIGAPDVAERCHHLNSSSPAELAELARGELAEPHRRLSTPWASELLVVVGDRRLPGIDESLLEGVGRVAGLVSIGGPATTRLVVGDASTTLEPDGIVLTRSSPSSAQLELLAAMLVGTAADPEIERLGVEDSIFGAVDATSDLVDESDDALAFCGAPSSGSDERFLAGPLEVRILTPAPTIEGWAVPPSTKDRARVVELVAFLALHERSSTTDRIRDAVFSRGDRVASLGRVHNVCSAARSALGSSLDGRSYLPASAGGRYRLESSVTCDWTRFEAMRRRAVQAGAEEATALLTEALKLVEGTPLAEVGSGWGWLLAEGVATSIVSSVVDGAHHLVTLAAASGDAALARWAVSRGRSAEPWSEILARDAMVIADLDGDRDAVRRTWRALERALDGLDGNEPSAETRALYEELVG